MPKLPSMSSGQLVRLLEKAGAVFVRQGKTDHSIYSRIAGGRRYSAPVQMGKKTLDPIYFFSENHALRVWSEPPALPVMVLSFTRSNGVLDDWSVENHQSGYIYPRTVHGKLCWYELPCF